MSVGQDAMFAAGALIVAIALADLFVTVFNYDGFSFLANRLHGVLWRAMRVSSRVLPRRSRHTVLSLGSASMLPATYILWLGLEVAGFALMFEAQLQGMHHAFTLNGAGRDMGSAFYLSAGAISSLTFGDIVPHGGLARAITDLETIVGLTTFTLALGYVVTTFDVLRTLDSLHAIVRRHAEDPARPSSILARHFRGGSPSELPSLLESISEKLEDYDQGLRRYPVVYYFHTRRLGRSIPRIFANLGRLVALLRWGLPAGEAMTQDPLLVALINEYGTTLDRLQRSFVGPPELEPPTPVGPDEFAAGLRALSAGGEGRVDPGVAAFRDLQHAARSSAGLDGNGDGDGDGGGGQGADARASYEQYREWLPFAHRNRIVLERIATTLGYELEF